tara:strand:- start:551 stop:1078 length:528 start_codon:yes stop_codon:yes gene_type:complete
MNVVLYNLRFFIYLPFALICSLRLIFFNKFILIDLDYSLCKNEILLKKTNNPDYMNLDIKINKDLEEKIKVLNISGYHNVIFSSRGIRANKYSRKWLKTKRINHEAFFHLGNTSLKIIPILTLVLFSKDFVLFDDLCNVKEGKLRKSIIYNSIHFLEKKKFLMWEDPQNKENENF